MLKWLKFGLDAVKNSYRTLLKAAARGTRRNFAYLMVYTLEEISRLKPRNKRAVEWYTARSTCKPLDLVEIYDALSTYIPVKK